MERGGHPFAEFALVWSKHHQLKGYWTEPDAWPRLVLAARAMFDSPPKKLTHQVLGPLGRVLSKMKVEAPNVDVRRKLADDAWPGATVVTDAGKR